MITVIKGNKREVPPMLPPLVWWEQVMEAEASDLSWMLWYDPLLEYLPPDDLQRVRAKARVWLLAMGEYPRDINCWWEIRQGRKARIIPLRDKGTVGAIQDDGVLICQECKARWSAQHDGSDHANRCKLCGCWWIHQVQPRPEEVRI